MKQLKIHRTQLGQAMTEYIIIVALIAIAAIGVYQAFGGIVRGQTSAAASSLAGTQVGQARTETNREATNANNQARTKALNNFEN